MRRPADHRRKRKPATVDRGGLGKLDSSGRQIDRREYNEAVPLYQAKPSCNPIALARKFGLCHAVFVRHQRGQEERRGLFDSAKNASLAAKELNRLFSQERGAGA